MAPDPTLVSIAAAEAALGREGPVERRDTHMSVVLIGGDRVLKIRRAIAFAFADHRSLDARRASAEAELRLNAELAPGVYVAVHGVVAGSEPSLVAADDPAAIDFVVEMRRFDESATLAARVRAGEPDAGLASVIDELAMRIARFHRSAPHCEDVPADPAGAAAALIRATETELGELRSLVTVHEQVLVVHGVAARLEAAAMVLADEAARRGRDGLVRDCHGDLRAEHVVARPGEGLLVVDRLEYRRDLRCVDVADDLSFLVMDLTALGRPELAERLVAAYEDAGGAVCSPALLALFGARRALVRMKVELLRADQGGPDADSARTGAETMLRVARRLAWQTHGPLAIAVCGLSGSGKSRIAEALSEASGIPVIASDLVRKRMLGIAPAERAGEAGYVPAVTERVYVELAERAAERVAAGLPVIVDATFLRRHDRALLAARTGERVLFVECTAPDAVLEARLAARGSDPGAVSDADAAVLARQRVAREPLDEIAPEKHVLLGTDRPVGDCVAMIEIALSD